MKKIGKGLVTGALALSFVCGLPFIGGCNEEQIKDLEKQVATLTSEKSALETENAGLKTSKSELETQVATLTGEKNSLVSQNGMLNTQNTSLNEAINGLFKMAFYELNNKINMLDDCKFKSKAIEYNDLILTLFSNKVIKLDEVYEVTQNSNDLTNVYRVKFRYSKEGSFWIYIKDSTEVGMTAFNIKWLNAEFNEAVYYEYTITGESESNIYIKYKTEIQEGVMDEPATLGFGEISNTIKRTTISNENRIVLEQE